MIKIIDGNDTGKTKKLLAQCSKVDGLFVCKHPERVAEKCEAYGVPLVVSKGYHEFIKENILGSLNSPQKVFIDELEEFIKVLVNLSGYSMTYDWPNESN